MHFCGAENDNSMNDYVFRKDHLPQRIPPPGDEYDEANVDYVLISKTDCNHMVKKDFATKVTLCLNLCNYAFCA